MFVLIVNLREVAKKYLVLIAKLLFFKPVIEIWLFLQLALAYNESLLNGQLATSRGSIIQSAFLGSLQKCIDDLLSYSASLKDDLPNYLTSGMWPEDNRGGNSKTVLSWYLQWYGVPAPSVIKTVVEKLQPLRSGGTSSCLVPLLHLLFPKTHMQAITDIDKFCFSPLVSNES